MRHPSTHGKFLALSSVLLLVAAATTAAAACGLLTSPRPDRVSEAFDRIVPGMTRADDLAGLGFDPHAGTIADNAALSQIKDRAADACIAADRYCTGYVFAGGVVLLVMDGRVIDKVITRA